MSVSNSAQKFIARNRAPRVQIEYDVEIYGSEKKVELPFVMGVLAELLLKKAREGRQVRLLIWHDPLGSAVQNNMPGYTAEIKKPSQFSEAKWDYCVAWWAQVRRLVPNLSVRLRRGDDAKAKESGRKYFPGAQGSLEKWLLETQATHHQKPILIDYEAAGNPGARPVGYVMGLNSITDYWDTRAHLHQEPLRENSYGPVNHGSLLENRQAALENRQPLRDYAIRVEGEALHCLNRNFSSAWERAEIFSAGRFGHLAPHRAAIRPAQLVPAQAQHRVQIVRTQPEENDATILEAYLLATANARKYLYVENQYFQLAEWASFLKKLRQDYLKMACKAKARPEDMGPLYLFVVIPQPEDDGMVPRTYDTLAELGEAERMAGYHQAVQAHQAPPHPEQNPSLADQLAFPFKVMRREAQGDDVRRSAQLKLPALQKKELEEAGIKVLVAMLSTFNALGQRTDPKSRYRPIYIHSKLLMVDDVFTTLGSANLNIRSMAVDSEINLSVADKGFSRALRREVWGDLAGKDLNGGGGRRTEIANAHKDWKDRMTDNQLNKDSTPPLPYLKNSFILPFKDERGVPLARTA